MDRRGKPQMKLRMEMLEARDVPTTATLTDHTLTITGTGGADSITVKQTNTQTTVSGVTGSFVTGQINLIVINSGAGDDTVALDASGFTVTKPAVIRGGSGNDTIHSGNGADYIDGESGDDDLRGGGGADKIAGDTGDDVIYGNGGNDSLAGGAGNDKLYGGSGVDHIWGGADFDYIEGGSGKDHIYDDFAFWAVQINDDNYVHHHILGVADNSGFGWFDANLPDPDIRRRARAADRNNYIGREEMISLFVQATDGSTVNSDEFNSLNALVHTDQVSINGPARYFGKKIIDGDPANQWFTGGDSTRHALGNLHAGDTDDHMQKLIDKWFLGKDHPMAKSLDRTTTFGYSWSGGIPFVDGPTAADIRQFNANDCYWLAALGAVARKNPDTIRNMFIVNGDGTYTVRLYRDGHPEYVTVDSELPVDGDGKFVFASQGRQATFFGNELWVPLAEKAYAQFNESGWTGQDGTNSYNGIGAAVPAGVENKDGIGDGSAATALKQITNHDTSGGFTGFTSFADVKAAFAGGKAVVFNTSDNPPKLAGNHSYMMVGYNTARQTITLRNPEGGPELTLTFADVQANSSSWDAAIA